MSISDFASAAQIGMPGIATPAAPGSAVSSLAVGLPSRASGVSRFRHLGLAMRFMVEVTGVKIPGLLKLGGWTSCDGLKVDFKFDSVRSGGEYSSTHVLPQHISYSQVTLKRAVEFPYSEYVQQWLRQVALEWNRSDGEPNLRHDRHHQPARCLPEHQAASREMAAGECLPGVLERSFHEREKQ